jgi:hypothetical protein
MSLERAKTPSGTTRCPKKGGQKLFAVNVPKVSEHVKTARVSQKRASSEIYEVLQLCAMLRITLLRIKSCMQAWPNLSVAFSGSLLYKATSGATSTR